MLQTIVEIAIDYHQINAFNKRILNQVPNFQGIYIFKKCSYKFFNHLILAAKNVSTVPSNTQDNTSFGFYITAFCSGVHKVLDAYRKENIALEEMFLQNPQLSLTFILCKVEKYRTLFQTLISMIHTIQNDNVHGCLLIGRLHKYVNCGVDQISLAASE